MYDSDVVIIGAPRSGTNMLRDVLTSLPGFTTWPCDEINPIWKHGNRTHPSDELQLARATPEVKAFVRGRFERVRTRGGGGTVVEKTCANSLRVGFVREVLPNARILFITRDGFDAAASALARWDAPVDLRYTMAKARFVPVGDVPYYGARYLLNRVRRGRAGPRVRWWGPRPEDFEDLLITRPLDEIALIQWQRCVDAAQDALAGLSPSQLLHISYETFVREPEDGLREVLDFLGSPERFRSAAVASVTAAPVGKGRASLSAESRVRWAEIAGLTLRRLGYAS